MDGVSIVVPTWNRRALLEDLLQRMERQTLRPAEVIVVDNGSEDGSAEAAERAGARVIRLERNQGFAAAVNRGVEICGNEWAAVVNNDVEPREDWLERLLEGARAGDAWFATGKLLRADDSATIDGAWDEIARSGCAERCGSGLPDGPRWNTGRSIRFAPFTAVLCRRRLFQEVGGLDERFESYLEDVDFGLRCALRGLGGVYVPEAVARHHGSATLGKWHGATVRRIARNQLLLVAKHYPRGWFRHYGWAVFVGQGLWGAVAMRHGAGGAFARGKWEGIRDFPEMRRTAAPASERESIRRILKESEAEIRKLQQETGFSTYWKIYCALT